MPLDITYFDGHGRLCEDVYGNMISSAQVTLSGTSAQSAAAPPGAGVARITASEACRVTGFTVNPVASATLGTYLAAGAVIDMTCQSGQKLAAITATL